MKHTNFSSDSMTTCLAVDVGGTKILVGEVDENGKIIRNKKYTSVVTNQEIAMKSIISAISDYIDTVGFLSSKVVAIGIGLVGRVDKEKGLWLEIDPNRSESVPVAKIISEKFNLPCTIDNDVHCAVQAENSFGWGKRSQNYIYINIGTGIAAGFVINGNLMRGASFNAGEIGHHVVCSDSDVECSCGRIGCVEAIASGMGMDQRARKLKKVYKESPLNIAENAKCSIKEIFNLSDKGDELCRLITEDAADSLANMIMNLVRVSDPDTVILGGGIISDGWLLSKVTKKLNSSTMRFVRNGIVLTTLDPNYIGLIGAGIIGLEKYMNLQGGIY